MSNVNPLLATLKMPGRIFQLPSRGLFYTGNELSAEIPDAEIHVHPMSAFDEISMKNPDLLYSGRAVDEVLKTCIPEILKPTELYGKDVDAVMLFLRLVTYGPNYDVTVTHTCDEAKPHSYVVDLEALLQNMKYLDVTALEQVFTVRLPNGQVVNLQAVRYSHILELLRANEGKKTLTDKDQKDNLYLNLLNVIKSVDNIEDKQQIKEWLGTVPAPYVSKIIDKIDQTNDWGPDLKVELTCKDCGEKLKVEIPINPISFFS